MANATWPPELPQIPLKGVSGGLADARLVSPMDMGPPKMRPRYTATSDPRTAEIVVTETQLDAFVTFWREVIGMGAQRFDWVDPTGDALVELRFTQPPTWRQIRPGPTKADRSYRLTLPLEVMP